MPSHTDLLNCLRQVNDPELGKNLVDLGMIRELKFEDGEVSFTLALTIPGCPMRQKMAGEAENVLLTLPDVKKVQVNFGQMTDDERRKMFSTVRPVMVDLKEFNQVKKVIAILSGKGGVGKSSTTALLASALRRQGKRVGILDADITGPSIPKLFGLPPGGLEEGEGGSVIPAVSTGGIEVISTNLLIREEDLAIIWRGPMIANTIQKFWRDTMWGELDYLLVDMPPGTSDAAITVMKQLPLDGAVLVTTPQELASMVVKKAVHLAEKMNQPILSVVENMSYFRCPDDGNIHHIFGPSHMDDLVEMSKAEHSIKIPIDPNVTALCDAGRVEEVTSAEFDELADFLTAN